MNEGDRVKYVDLEGSFNYGIQGVVNRMGDSGSVQVDWERVVPFRGETQPSVQMWWCQEYELEVVASAPAAPEAEEADYIPLEPSPTSISRRISESMNRAVRETSASLRSGNTNAPAQASRPTRAVRPSGIIIDDYLNDPYPGIIIATHAGATEEEAQTEGESPVEIHAIREADGTAFYPT
jgi:hypothetical protein